MGYHPRENLGVGYGVGFFHLVEVMAATPVTKINYLLSFALISELCSLMRGINPTCTVMAEDFASTLTEELPPAPSGLHPDKYQFLLSQVKKTQIFGPNFSE